MLTVVTQNTSTPAAPDVAAVPAVSVSTAVYLWADGVHLNVNAPHLVALVRAGARFKRGQLVERPTPDTVAEAA